MSKVTKTEELEEQITELLTQMHALDVERYKPDTVEGISSFIVTFVRTSPDLNPGLDDLQIFGQVIDHNIPVDEDGNMLETLSLDNITIPLEQRMSMALRHLWHEVIPELLGSAPCVKLAGTSPDYDKDPSTVAH